MSKVAKAVGAVVFYATAAIIAGPLGAGALLKGLVATLAKFGNLGLRVRDSAGDEWVALASDVEIP